MEMAGKEGEQWSSEGHFLEEGTGQKLWEKRRDKAQWLEGSDTQLSWFRTTGWQGQMVFTNSSSPAYLVLHSGGPISVCNGPLRVAQSQLRLAVASPHWVSNSVFTCKCEKHARHLRSLRMKVCVGFGSFQISMPLLPIKVDQMLLSRKDPGVSWPIHCNACWVPLHLDRSKISPWTQCFQSLLLRVNWGTFFNHMHVSGAKDSKG